jgi:hypothetical protein
MVDIMEKLELQKLIVDEETYLLNFEDYKVIFSIAEENDTLENRKFL